MPKDSISKKLTGNEKVEVERIIDADIEFFDYPEFHPPKQAEEELFGGEDNIPAAESGWYLSYMNQRDKLIDWNSTPKKANVLLTPDQEARLFLRFNFAKFKLYGLTNKANKSMTAKLARDILKWHRIALGLREQLAEMNLAIVLSAVKKYSRCPDDSDMVSLGNERLLTCIDKFDVSLKFKFSTYAWRAIMRAIIRERKAESKRRDIFPVEFDPDKEDELRPITVDYSKENAELIRHILNDNLADLTPREKTVTMMRYFIERPNGGRFRLEELGEQLGVSRTCVQLAERSAVQKIRDVWRKLVE